VAAAILYGGLDGSFFAGGEDEKYHAAICKLSEKTFIHHSWKHTIEMIMGMDACLENAGYPGVFDTGNSDKTLKYLKKVYKNRTLFELSEMKELFKLPKGYLAYLLKRVLKSNIGKMGFSKLKSFENDLSKMHIRIGTSAEIHFNSGEILKGECDIPKGFAGDPHQKCRVKEKFERECMPVYGPEYTALLLTRILKGGIPKLPETFARISIKRHPVH
jgi:hypothetical protein